MHATPAPNRKRVPSSLVAAAVAVALAQGTGVPARAADLPDASAGPSAEGTPAGEPAPQQMPKVSVEADDASAFKVDESSSAKFVAPLLDTPQTVTIIPRALIEERNATTLREALRNTSGITFQAGEGGGGLSGDQNFTLRGFSARSSLFVDGIRDLGSYARDTFFIEQVEVAKGPTAVVAGRGATGGLINQVTKTPLPDALATYALSAGTDDYIRATADVNQPFGSSAALRLNVMYDDADVPDRDVVETSRWGFAPSVAFGLGTATRFSVAYLHIDQDNIPDYGLPWNTPQGPDTGLDLDFSNFYGLEDYDYEDIDTDSATARIVHDFSESLTIESTLRWLDTLRDSATTAPRPPDRQLQQRRQRNELYANQTNLIGRFDWGGVAHRLTTGLDLSREEAVNRNQSQTTNQPPIFDVDHPDPGEDPLGPMPPNVGNPGPSATTVDTVALYVFDTIELDESWSVHGGLRWETYDVEYELDDLVNGAHVELDRSGDELSWQAGVVFKPTANSSLYAAYGTSFDPAYDAAATGLGFGTTPTSPNLPSLEPEKSRNYEVGAKWERADGRLAATAAVFRTEKFNARTRASTDDAYTLDGEQQVTGVELSLNGNLTDRWSAFAGYVFMDSEFEASDNPAEVGDTLVLTPEHTFNLWTSYLLPLGLEIGVGAQYMDSVFRNTTSAVEVPSYGLFDAMLTYPVSDTLTLRLNANNVADEEYVDRVGGGHFVPGPGRRVSLTANLRF
jgi:catecholate siderophore receptor